MRSFVKFFFLSFNPFPSSRLINRLALPTGGLLSFHRDPSPERPLIIRVTRMMGAIVTVVPTPFATSPIL